MLTESALRSRRFGDYTLQAAIAAVHAETSSAASTDWRQITLLYDRLIRIQPSPVVELNRAVLAREELANYPLAYSARADLRRRLGRLPEARASFDKALALARQEPKRRFPSGLLEELK